MLDTRVVDTGYVGRGEHPNDPGNGERLSRAERGDPAVGESCLHRPGGQCSHHAQSDIVGVLRLTRDVASSAFVRGRCSDDRVDRALRQ